MVRMEKSGHRIVDACAKNPGAAMESAPIQNPMAQVLVVVVQEAVLQVAVVCRPLADSPVSPESAPG